MNPINLPTCDRPAVARFEVYSPDVTLYGSLDAVAYACAEHLRPVVAEIKAAGFTTRRMPTPRYERRCGHLYVFATGNLADVTDVRRDASSRERDGDQPAQQCRRCGATDGLTRIYPLGKPGAVEHECEAGCADERERVAAMLNEALALTSGVDQAHPCWCDRADCGSRGEHRSASCTLDRAGDESTIGEVCAVQPLDGSAPVMVLTVADGEHSHRLVLSTRQARLLTYDLDHLYRLVGGAR